MIWMSQMALGGLGLGDPSVTEEGEETRVGSWCPLIHPIVSASKL